MTDYSDPTGIDRVPPNHTQAEQAVLGGMLLSRAAILDTVEVFDGITDPWYRPAHAAIFDAILDLYGKGEPADPITVTAALVENGKIGQIGGGIYLNQCVQQVVTAANTRYYAEAVRNTYWLRRIIEAGTNLVQLGYSGRTDEDGAKQALDEAATRLQDLLTAFGNKTDDREWHLGRVLAAAISEYESPVSSALPLPWTDVESCVSMEPGDFVVIGARPGMGKSVVLMDIARHVAIRHGLRVLVASMEMSHLQMGQRILSAEAAAPLHHIKGRYLDDVTKARVWDTARDIAEADLSIDDRPGRTVAGWRTRLRQLQAEGRLPHLLVVDYLQITKAEMPKGTNRTIEVDSIAAGLKELAMEFQIVVIAAAQLNRALANRTDKTPTMADLRESGGIEANANTVILLHREDAYEKESPRSGEMDLVIAKNRQGASGARITVAWQGHFARAVDMAKA
jgi:replicative DNA helicase